MSNSNLSSLFLKHVHLSGYKSIDDVEIDFHNGLNIIIGKNAAGKTNFLRFLNRCLAFEFDDLSNFSSVLTFQNGKTIQIKSSVNLKLDELISESRIKPKVKTTLTIGKKVIKDKKDSSESIATKLRSNEIFFANTFICHGTPKDYPIVEKPFSFKVENKNRLSADLLAIMGEYSAPYFLKSLAIDLLVASTATNDEKQFDAKMNKIALDNIFKRVSNLGPILKTFSPIEDIKISDNYNLYITDDGESYTVNNIFLEFKVGRDWLPFSNLSDGTRRIFYIISEVYNYEPEVKLRPVFGGVSYKENIPRIILIEEPELGLHPHQFRKLMSFLKENANFNQIILTTHSPQTLDILGQDDLEKIVIAYNSEDGTKLKHLNKQEIEKAKIYINEEFLSDYWLYSDLEKLV